jgi:hypothetical protein
VVVALVAGFSALGVAVAAKNAFPPIGTAFYEVVVPAGVGLFVALVPVAALVLRGRSDSLRRLGIAVGVGAYVVPCYTAAALVTINGALDASRPARAESRVLARWVTSGKSPERKLRLAGIRGGEGLELTVDRGLYERLAEGDPVTVVTGDGALGWRWVQRVEPVKGKRRK